MFGLGIWELLIILAIVLLIFGGRRLPQIGTALGKTARELKNIPREKIPPEKEASESGDAPEQPARAPSPIGLKDIGQLRTNSGRLRLLGRWLTKGRF